MSQYYAVVRNGNYLEHHGVKGMKWGVRRFQRLDGSRTAAGLKRYAEGARSKIRSTVNRFKTDKKFRRRVALGAAAVGAAGLAAYGAYKYNTPEARLKRLDRNRTYDAKMVYKSKDPATVKEFQKRLKKNTSRYIDTKALVDRRAAARASKADAKAAKKSFKNSKKWLDRANRQNTKETNRVNKEVNKYFKSEARKAKVQALKNKFSDARAMARAQTSSHNNRQRELNKAFKAPGSWINNAMAEGYAAGKEARNNYMSDDYLRDVRNGKKKKRKFF